MRFNCASFCAVRLLQTLDLSFWVRFFHKDKNFIRFELLCPLEWNILEHQRLRNQLMQNVTWGFDIIALHKFISVLVGEKGDHLLRFCIIEGVHCFKVLINIRF